MDKLLSEEELTEELKSFVETYFEEREELEEETRNKLEEEIEGSEVEENEELEKVEKIKSNKLHFSEVDVLNVTPVLDIKPYVKHFDIRNNTVSGWLDKHFQSTDMPDKTIIG